ncbi:unnamed protein product [Rhizophagus irregularis]|nr:unnamed protein product [Rhizophagus irregularis]
MRTLWLPLEIMCLILNYSFNKTFLVSLLSRITANSLDLFGHIGFHILIVSSSFSMQDFREFFCFLLILTSNANILGFLV